MSSTKTGREHDRSLIFVAGLARSGTTLLQSIFAQHPAVFSFPETHFFEAVGNLDMYDTQLTGEALDELGSEVLKRGGLEQEEWVELRRTFLEGISQPCDVKTLFLSLVELYGRRMERTKSDIALEKTPGHVFQLCRLLHLFPKARFFLLRRNPRDYANSIAKCTWAPGSVDKIGSLWSDTIKVIGSIAKGEKERIKVVDYEDLTKNPKSTMAACFDHVGLEFRENFLVGLKEIGRPLVRPAEVEWKLPNLSHDTVLRSVTPLDFTIKQRLRLMLSVSPGALTKYPLWHLRF